jgi:uncharacterized membrane protein
VFYFFFQIWGRIGTPVQIGILSAVPIVALVGTDLVARRERRRYFTSVVALLALTAFIVGSKLTAATFNMPLGSYALVCWAALALLLAYAYRVHLALVAGLLMAATVPSALIFDATGADWAAAIFLRPDPIVAAGIAMFFLAELRACDRHPGFGAFHRSTAMFLVFFPAFLLAGPVAGSALPLGIREIHAVYQIGGLLAAAGSVWLGVARRLRHVVNGGTLAFAVMLVSSMADWWWDTLPRSLFFLLVAAFALGIVAVLRRLHAAIGPAARGALL